MEQSLVSVFYIVCKEAQKNFVFNYRNSLQHKFYSIRLMYKPSPLSLSFSQPMWCRYSTVQWTHPFPEADLIYFD